MGDENSVYASRIGRHPNETREIHRQRQTFLAVEARADDPSNPARVVERGRRRDDIERGRQAFRTSNKHD